MSLTRRAHCGTLIFNRTTRNQPASPRPLPCAASSLVLSRAPPSSLALHSPPPSLPAPAASSSAARPWTRAPSPSNLVLAHALRPAVLNCAGASKIRSRAPPPHPKVPPAAKLSLTLLLIDPGQPWYFCISRLVIPCSCPVSLGRRRHLPSCEGSHTPRDGILSKGLVLAGLGFEVWSHPGRGKIGSIKEGRSQDEVNMEDTQILYRGADRACQGRFIQSLSAETNTTAMRRRNMRLTEEVLDDATARTYSGAATCTEDAAAAAGSCRGGRGDCRRRGPHPLHLHRTVHPHGHRSRRGGEATAGDGVGVFIGGVEVQAAAAPRSTGTTAPRRCRSAWTGAGPQAIGEE